MTDFIFGLTPGDVVYDIETYPNTFTNTIVHVETGDEWVFELSPRRNDMEAMCRFIDAMKVVGNRMVGFNNLGFDYPVIHFIYNNWHCGVSVDAIYQKAMTIIKGFDKFGHIVWESDWLVPQIDLYKIHHFDNKARATSLKVLEFNMRMSNIEDLPFSPGTPLTNDQIPVLLDYNRHDVEATVDFYHHSADQIKFREELTDKHGRNFMNHNDTKIGKDFLIMELEERQPGCCYKHIDGRRCIVQTPRESIALKDVILPVVNFNHPEFQRILEYFQNQVITETKGVFKGVSCTVNGFEFDFGTGGIHGSVESSHVQSDDGWIIEDWDVKSYYPNLAIKNQLYPAHLGQMFCTVYEDLYQQRKGYAKGTTENAMLKWALNGVYGDSNNPYSPFYDPQYTMSITINGQLLLCMLAEALLAHNCVQLIQINTDGLTIRYPRDAHFWVRQVAQWWEDLTRLELESAEYTDMWVKDVNNYLAVYK